MIDLYGSEYGWSRSQIMEDVYIDEYFLQKDIINKRKKEKYLLDAQLHMLPHISEKDRNKFLKELTSDTDPVLNAEVKTDFSAIDKAREQLNRY